MRVSLATAVVVLTLCVPVPHASAAEDSSAGDAPQTRARPLYVTLFAGDFNADPDRSRLAPSGGGYGWGLGGGYFLNPYLSLDGEFLWFRRDYRRVSDTVRPGTANNDVRVLSLGLLASVRVGRSFSRWRPFVSGGVGWFDTELFTTDPDSGLFTDAGDPAAESSTGYQLSAGVSCRLRHRSRLELGWRRLFLEADFGPYSNGSTELGGDFLYLALRGGGF